MDETNALISSAGTFGHATLPRAAEKTLTTACKTRTKLQTRLYSKLYYSYKRIHLALQTQKSAVQFGSRERSGRHPERQALRSEPGLRFYGISERQRRETGAKRRRTKRGGHARATNGRRGKWLGRGNSRPLLLRNEVTRLGRGETIRPTKVGKRNANHIPCFFSN